MTFIADRSSAGYVPLQDHRKGVTVGARLGPAAVRLVDPEGADDPRLMTIAKVGGNGTAGDYPGWRWHEPDARECGAWTQFVVGRVVGTSFGSSNNTDARGRPVTGKSETQTATALPVRTSGLATDNDFKKADHTVPSFWPAFPKGYVVGLGAGTHEGQQEDLLVPLDPRIVVANKNAHDQMGTIFADLDPADTISTRRAARAQTMERVVFIPPLEGLKTGGGPTRAWQLTLTGQGKQTGMGAAYGKVEAKKKPPGTPEIGKDPVVSPGTGPNAPDPGPGNASPGGAVDAGLRTTGYLSDADKGGYGRKGQGEDDGLGVAMFSREAWGPLHCGHEDDQHRFDTNEDGESVNSGHLDVDRHFWYREKDRDAPLEFDKKLWGPVAAPYRTRAWIRYDDLSVHGWNGQSKKGLWRLEAESFFTNRSPGGSPPPTSAPPITPSPDPDPPEPPPPPVTPPADPPEPPEPPAPPTTPGDPPATTPPPGFAFPGEENGFRPTLPGPYPRNASARVGGAGSTGLAISKLGHGHRYVEPVDRSAYVPEAVAWSGMQLGFPGALAFPQHLGRGGSDLRYSGSPEQYEVDRNLDTTPAVARLISWGAQSGQEWDYTEKPGYSRVRSGTADGGWLIVPPEVDEMDYGSSFAPTGLSRSTTYLGWGPGAYAGFGVADPTSGDLANGAYRFGWSSSILRLQRRASGAWTDVLSLDASGHATFSGVLASSYRAGFQRVFDFEAGVNGQPFIAAVNGTGAVSQVATLAADRVGAVTVNTGAGAGAGNSASLLTHIQALALGAGELTLEFDVKVPTLPTGAQDFTCKVGLMDQHAGTAVANSVTFEQQGSGVANWQCVTMLGGVATTTGSGVAVGTGIVKLKMVIDASATNVYFYIDGTLVATHTTNIPVVNLGFGIVNDKVAGAGARPIHCDLIAEQLKRTTAI